MTERIRDPLHNLIEFDVTDEFERTMWNVLQTRPFQRLRRIKQLGFSEVVYPGACHSRFMHSLGVYHTARRLMGVVKSSQGGAYSPTKAYRALAAALVHDLGHGPFSHAFEAVGERLDLKLASHEVVSEQIIRGGEVAEELNALGTSFSDDVADIVAEEGDKNVYRAVVSSQFDADRLDYMRRDRLMTGAQSGGIDFEWLLANLKIGQVATGVDEQQTGTIETFVLGPKAIMAAEAYVLGLFQLYPSVYFHKTTRVCEKHFVELLCRTIELIWNGDWKVTGLPRRHPIVTFAKGKDKIDHLLDLDDTVMWGSLTFLRDSQDPTISEYANRLLARKLYKCRDVMSFARKNAEDVEAFVKSKIEDLKQWSQEHSAGRSPRILFDEATRSPYKSVSESKGPPDRINVETQEGRLLDLREMSDVVKALKPFRLSRAYHAPDDLEAATAITAILEASA